MAANRTNKRLADLCAAYGSPDPGEYVDGVQWILADVPAACERMRAAAWGQGPLHTTTVELGMELIGQAIISEMVALDEVLRTLAGIAEHLAQLVNCCVFKGKYGEEERGLVVKVIADLRALGGFDDLADALETLKDDGDLLYVRDYANVVKHRKLIAAEKWTVEVEAGGSLKEGVLVEGFAYEGRSYNAEHRDDILGRVQRVRVAADEVLEALFVGLATATGLP